MTESTVASDLRAIVVDTTASPCAEHRPLPVDAVRLTDEFLAPRLRINREVTIPGQYEFLEETGRLNNFRRLTGDYDGPFVGIFFNDSDVYKWLEAASWSLATNYDEGLLALVDTVIALIEGAQQADGYINTYFALERADERWSNLRDKHELYCAGHLIQAAVAHHRATGSDRLLRVATRFADLICDTFGPASEGRREETDGHEEIEMALIELFRTTGARRYLDQARFFIDIRGTGTIGGSPYCQDATPLREQETMVGHAVRAVYLNAGAADLVAEDGDPALKAALERMWTAMVSRRMYVSGGLGARWEGEAFGDDYELPNSRAYTETCAAIGSVMWSWRMLLLSAADDTRYADLIERQLYNAILPGISLDGQGYFYQNPLADDGTHRRQPWFGCACCPPNVARMLASVGGYVATVTTGRGGGGESDITHDTIWLHLFADGTVKVHLPAGGMVKLRVRTRYPWDGDLGIEVEEVQDAGSFTLQVRIPDWARSASGSVGGHKLPPSETAPGQYATITRVWKAGDRVRITLPMPVRRVLSHPRVMQNTGRVALMRGPLLYCVEAVDHHGQDVRTFVLPDSITLEAERRDDLLNGVMVLTGHARNAVISHGWRDHLFREASEVAADEEEALPVPLTAVPYFAWANREVGPMRVWLPRQ